MKPCSALSSHYSAFVDGELTPLEAVAVRKHLARCASCRREVQELENMKLAVHMHKDSIPTPPSLTRRLEERLGDLERRRMRRIQGGFAAAAIALAIIVVIGSPATSIQADEGASPPHTTSTQALAPLSSAEDIKSFNRIQSPARWVDDSVFADLVKRHQGVQQSPLAEQQGLLSFEALPVRLMDAGPHVRQVVNASYQRCLQTRSGASLAILDATQMRLPPQAEESLDRIGFYVEHRGSVEVRVSQSGQRLFVLLTDKTQRVGSVI